MLEISAMQLDELRMVLGWAAEEGWNPGLDDAEAFHAADPGGFLLGRLGGQPVAAMSLVRHSPEFAFLGLYLCRPEFRGQGHGWAVWQAGMALAGHRSVGLDGVPAQQDNYRKSGFKLSHRTIRFAGAAPAAGAADPLRREDVAAALALDRAVQGVARAAYLGPWVGGSKTRQSVALRDGDRLAGLATIRACAEGHKIGPLIAPDTAGALKLIGGLVAVSGARQIVLDVPERNRVALDMAEQLELAPSFETARMYKGAPPRQAVERIFGETTLELG